MSGRETSGATTRLLLGYVREQAGAAGVAAVLARAGVRRTAAELEDPAVWISYAERVGLFQAAAEVLEDPDVMFRVGASVLHQAVNPSLVPLLRALGSPRQGFEHLPRAVPRFTSTSTMRVVDSGPTHAVIRYRLHEGYEHSRLDCRYAQGLFSVLPQLFGLEPARIMHQQCQSDGWPECVYHVSWARYSRWPWRRRKGLISSGDTAELIALRGQFEALQSAGADLVSSDALDVVLGRITERAAAAVLAQGYLLAVKPPAGGPPLVRYAGIGQARADELAHALLEGEDLGPSAVVVDVASTRRWHGRLAALHAPGQVGLAGEVPLLAAYARHAAAAMDLILALEGSRRGEDRAHALLALARQLATAADGDEVCSVVASALPGIVGCRRSSVLIWDRQAGELLPAASAGLDPAEQDVLAKVRLRPVQVPALAGMLTDHQPQVLHRDCVDPTLGRLFTDLGVTVLVAAPIVADAELLGVVTADFGPAAGAGPDAETVERLRGVADHAAIALRNARLLAEIRHRNVHDELTGLPNRALFLDRLTRALAEATAIGSTVAVLFCDLDDFKQVNDSHGHVTGDHLLRQVAARLQDAAPPPVTVARLAGDELALLVPAAASAEEAAQLARRVQGCFTRPFTADGQDLRITASVGLATHRGPGGRAERMLRDADTAMYRAKRDGIGRSRRPRRPAPPGGGRRRHALLRAELDAAAGAGELRLLYQPIISLSNGAVSAAEALLRWHHPQDGPLEPAHFLPTAQDSGAMPDLDLWVLRAACHAAASWPPGTRSAAPAVAVNLSGRTLADERLLPGVRQALRDSGLDPGRLILEITENQDLGDLDQTAQRLTVLRRLGLRIALDDFGTGYCGLTWLHRLPVDQLKLDGTFTAPLADPTGGDDTFIRAVLAGARTLGLDVVAEGVEHPAQLAALRRAGYPHAQGHLLGRPSEHLPQPGAAPVLGPVDTIESTVLRLVR